MSAQHVLTQLEGLADSAKASHHQRFFKTGPGQYGEGDIFLGIRVPVLRQISKENKSLPLQEVLKLLHSKYHEARLLALLIMVLQYKKADQKDRATIFNAYLKNTRWINNWDLVDSSAYLIVGPHINNSNSHILVKLADSEVLWERRISIIATLHFIRLGQFDYTLQLAKILLQDKEDLMHKAVGWMLREVGNRDRETEEKFLREHYRVMPRTMLRYAIEKFPEELRQEYLKK